MNCIRLFILLIVAVLAGCATQNSQNPYASAKKTYTAAETSRTIDLTHPPRDMWDRIRRGFAIPNLNRSEEHTSELQSLMRISYAVFCLKKKNIQNKNKKINNN